MAMTQYSYLPIIENVFNAHIAKGSIEEDIHQLSAVLFVVRRVS